MAPKIRFFTSLLCVLMLSALVHAQTQNFMVDVERQTMQLGETLTVTFQYRGHAGGETPDFSSLKQQFSIIGFYPSAQSYNINGQTIAIHQWQLQLEPKQQGTLLIPPITYKGETTEAVAVEVDAPGKAPDQLADVMLETIVDKSSAYVQEQVIVTYRLYYSVNVDQLDMGDLDIDDTIIKTLPNKRYRRRIDGVQYNVLELSRALIPQRSGTLLIPSITWQARIPKSRYRSLLDPTGHYEIKKLRSQEKILRIKSIPDTFPASAAWLPARSVTLSETWSHAPSALRIGEPVTREVTLEASGVEAAQIPSLMEEWQGSNLKSYLEPPSLNETQDAFGLRGKRTESAALVSTTTDSVTLPAVRIPWWNTETDVLEWAELPEKTLTASGPAPSQGNAIAPINTDATDLTESDVTEARPALAQERSYWPYALIALLVASNAVTLVLLWRRPRRAPLDTSMSAHANPRRSQRIDELLKQAAQEKDAGTLQNALVELSSEVLGKRSTSALIDHIATQDAQLASALTGFQSALFGASNDAEAPSPEVKDLANRILAWYQQRPDETHQKEALAPFFGS